MGRDGEASWRAEVPLADLGESLAIQLFQLGPSDDFPGRRGSLGVAGVEYEVTDQRGLPPVSVEKGR